MSASDALIKLALSTQGVWKHAQNRNTTHSNHAAAHV
jgi:hypothetical protein